MNGNPKNGNRESKIADARRRRLFGVWGKVCEKRAIEGTREERIAWANSILENRKAKIASWTELRPGEIGILVHAALVELGEADGGSTPWRAPYALRYVLWLVPQVYGAEWDSLVHARLERAPYRFYDSVERLDSRRMRGLIEEMLDTLARNQTAEIRNENEPLSSAELRAAKELIRAEMVKSVKGKGWRRLKADS